MSEPKASSKTGQTIIIALAVVLALVHQDIWYWDDGSLVMGFMPVGLAFHALFSLVAAALWALAIKIAWPHELEALAEEPDPRTPEKKGE